MKLINRILSIMLATLLLAGCSSNGSQVELGEHEIYLSLPAINDSASGEDELGTPAAIGFVFSSFDEMRDFVTRGKYTDEELRELNRLPKNAEGKVVAPNLDTMPTPSYPEHFVLDKVYWGGSSEYPNYELNSNGIIAFVSHLPEERMLEDLERTHFNPNPGKYGVEATESVTTANGGIPGTAYYSTNLGDEKIKSICYQFDAGDITYYVLERYYTGEKEVPYFTKLWFSAENKYIQITFHHSDNNVPLPQLSIEEISQFGFKK